MFFFPRRTGQVSAFNNRVRVTRNAAQSIPHNVETKIEFDTEDYDDNSEFTAGQFTCTQVGYYHFTAYGGVVSVGLNQAMVLAVKKNGVSIIGSVHRPGYTGDMYCVVSSDVKLNVNDYLEVFITQTTGAAKNTCHVKGDPSFTIHRFA